MPRLNADYYRSLFGLTPYPLLVLKPDAPIFTIIEVNNKYLETAHLRREEIVDQGILMAGRNITSWNSDKLISCLEKVVKNREVGLLKMFQWDLEKGGEPQAEAKYWDISGIPITNEAGDIEGILFAPQDITKAAKIEQDVRRN
jgi:hypothetical protein